MEDLSENLDIMYKLGKYDSRVFVTNKQIWNLKLSRINYMHVMVPDNRRDAQRYCELLGKSGKILHDKRCFRTERLDVFLNCICAFTETRIKKMKIKMYELPPADELGLIVRHVELMKIETDWGRFNMNFEKLYKLLRTNKDKVILRATNVWSDDGIADLEKLTTLGLDIKLTAADSYQYKKLKDKKENLPEVINPEIYRIYGHEEKYISIPFCKKRTIKMERTDITRHELFHLILKKTEIVRIDCEYNPNYLESVKGILYSIRHLDLPDLKLLVFETHESSGMEDLLRKYRHLRTNITYIKFSRC